MSNVSYRLFTEHLGNVSTPSFQGDRGDLFYDPTAGDLFLGDGKTGGLLVTSSLDYSSNIIPGAGVSPTYNALQGTVALNISAPGISIGGVQATGNNVTVVDGVITVDLNPVNTFTQISLSTANTFLQANDAYVLSSLKNYNDTLSGILLGEAQNGGSNVSQKATITSLNNLQNYCNANDSSVLSISTTASITANTFLKANDSLVLASAKAYTDSMNTSVYLQWTHGIIAPYGTMARQYANDVSITGGNVKSYITNSTIYNPGKYLVRQANTVFYRSSVASIPAGVYYPVDSWDFADTNNIPGLSVVDNGTVTNSSGRTIYAIVNWTIAWYDLTLLGRRLTYLYKNGSATTQSFGYCEQQVNSDLVGARDYIVQSSSTLVKLAPGEYFNIGVGQDSGSAISIGGPAAGMANNHSSRLSITAL